MGRPHPRYQLKLLRLEPATHMGLIMHEKLRGACNFFIKNIILSWAGSCTQDLHTPISPARQPGLPRKFHISLNYTVKPCLKNKTITHLKVTCNSLWLFPNYSALKLQPGRPPSQGLGPCPRLRSLSTTVHSTEAPKRGSGFQALPTS